MKCYCTLYRSWHYNPLVFYYRQQLHHHFFRINLFIPQITFFLFFFFLILLSMTLSIDLRVTFLLLKAKWIIHWYPWVISASRLSYKITFTVTDLLATCVILVLLHTYWLVNEDSSTRSTIWFLLLNLTFFFCLVMDSLYHHCLGRPHYNILSGHNSTLLTLCFMNIILVKAYNVWKVSYYKTDTLDPMHSSKEYLNTMSHGRIQIYSLEHTII